MRKYCYYFITLLTASLFACDSQEQQASSNNIQVISQVSEVRELLTGSWESTDIQLVGDKDGSMGEKLMKRMGMSMAKVTINLKANGTYDLDFRRKGQGQWILSDDGKHIFLKPQQAPNNIQEIVVESLSAEQAIITLRVMQNQLRITLKPM